VEEKKKRGSDSDQLTFTCGIHLPELAWKIHFSSVVTSAKHMKSHTHCHCLIFVRVGFGFLYLLAVVRFCNATLACVRRKN